MSRRRRRSGSGGSWGYRPDAGQGEGPPDRSGTPAEEELETYGAEGLEDEVDGSGEEREPGSEGRGYADVSRRSGKTGGGGSRTDRGTDRRGGAGRSRPPGGRLSQSLRAPSPFPGFWRSIAVGLTAVGSSVTVLAVTLLLAPAAWLAALSQGLEFFPPGMLTVLALPPIGSLGDLGVGSAIYALGTGTLTFLVVATVLRAILLSILAGLILDVIRYRRVSVVGLLRGLRGAPAVIAASLMLVTLILFSQIVLAQLLGASLGQLVFTVVLIGGLHLLVFVPAAAASELRPAREVIRRSVRAALLPGSRHLIAVLVYFLLSTTLIQLQIGETTLTANPSMLTWAIVLVANVFHVAFLAAFSYRWLAVQDVVPDVPLKIWGGGSRRPPPRARGGSRSRGSGGRSGGSSSRRRPR